MRAFEGMSPATDVGDAEWALSRMRGRKGVAFVVPERFPAVVRVMHELRIGDESSSPRWAEALPDFFLAGPNGFLHHQVEPYHVTDGTLPRDYLPRLLPLLAGATTTRQLSWYGLRRIPPLGQRGRPVLIDRRGDRG